MRPREQKSALPTTVDDEGSATARLFRTAGACVVVAEDDPFDRSRLVVEVFVDRGR